MERPLLKIFRNLEGQWLISRRINDAVNGKTEFAEGTAVFRSKPGVQVEGEILEYEETGVLTLTDANKQVNFRRNYIYKYADEIIEIYLDDGVTKGKLFQRLLQAGDADQCAFTGTEHICRTDKHYGSYNFINESAFETSFTIEGTNKSISITTVYKKSITENQQ